MEVESKKKQRYLQSLESLSSKDWNRAEGALHPTKEGRGLGDLKKPLNS